MEKLSFMNCHRVVQVCEAGVAENVYDFQPYARKERGTGMFDQQYHRLTNVNTKEDIYISVNATVIMGKYEVTKFNDKRHLGDLYQTAISAHNWSSMDPERAAKVEMVSYEEGLNADLANIPTEKQEEYYNKYHSWVSTILARESRIASAFVTGPAKFNNSKNEKANASYVKACEDFSAWRERTLKSIRKALEDAKPLEQREDERWEKIRHDLDFTANSIRDIDENNAPYHRSLFVNSLYGKAETLAKNGEKTLLDRYIKRVVEWNDKLKKPLITQRHKFWKLQELCERCVEKAEARSEKESVTIEKEGCSIVKNYSLDRLQLVFDGKPKAEVISKLKSNGFRWSPSNTAWQRQLTSNALYAAARVVDVTVEELRKAQ